MTPFLHHTAALRVWGRRLLYKVMSKAVEVTVHSWASDNRTHTGFPKIRVTFLGVQIIRSILFWALYKDPSILGNYHTVLGMLRRRQIPLHAQCTLLQTWYPSIIYGILLH